MIGVHGAASAMPLELLVLVPPLLLLLVDPVSVPASDPPLGAARLELEHAMATAPAPTSEAPNKNRITRMMKPSEGGNRLSRECDVGQVLSPVFPRGPFIAPALPTGHSMCPFRALGEDYPHRRLGLSSVGFFDRQASWAPS